MIDLAVGDVFVSGGAPTVTYVARDDTGLEASVKRYLDTGYKVLAISGPSKCGKTVLVDRMLEATSTASARVTGSTLEEIGDLWRSVSHQLGLPFERESTSGEGGDTSEQRTIKGGGASVLVEASAQTGNKSTWSAGSRQLERTSAVDSVKAALKERNVCLVVDDFHYANSEVKTALAREIKDLIYVGVRVVIISVPGRVVDVLQAEGDLTGRLTRLSVPSWTPMELSRIPITGFSALNLSDGRGELTAALVDQSYGNPLLMQDLCSEVCYYNEVMRYHDGPAKDLQAPAPWASFMAQVAANIRPALIEKLYHGPVQRRPRGGRATKAGGSMDLYEAVLVAIGNLAPKQQITLNELSTATTQFLTRRPELPKLRYTCTKLAEIAWEEKGEKDDPALEYLESPESIIVHDPYLIFYIAWGMRGFGS